MTRDELATKLENEAHNAAADRIRCGEDAREVLTETFGADAIGAGRRYDDFESANARALFIDVIRGKETIA